MIANKVGARWLPVRVDDIDAWQLALLEESARRLGVVALLSERIHRWGSICAPATYRGGRAWLRVSPFLKHEMDEVAWRGTREAAAIAGVRKPSLLAHLEWLTNGAAPVPVSAEILTLVEQQPATNDRFLYQDPNVADSWFTDLSCTLSALAAHSTDRRFVVHDEVYYERLLGATYRRRVPIGLLPEFATEHLDLSWSNVTAPVFQILDMEHWGRGVRGFGAAYLYLTSFPVPAVAARLHAALSDVLETPSGRYAQLVAAALIIRNLTRLPDPSGLAAALHAHTDALLA